MVQFWSLRALQEDGNTLADSSVLPIHIHKGENYIGRMDLKNSSKQVSRKHVSITASSQGNLQVFVAGQNPVVVRSGSERRKLLPQMSSALHVGDVIEFLPGKLAYRLTSDSCDVTLIPTVPSSSALVSKEGAETILSCSTTVHTSELHLPQMEKDLRLVGSSQQGMESSSSVRAVYEEEDVKDEEGRYPLLSKEKAETICQSKIAEGIMVPHLQVEESISTTQVLGSRPQDSETFLQASCGEEENVRKRKSQVLEDEAIARALQEEEDCAQRWEMGQFASSSHQNGFSRSRLFSVKEPKLDGMEMGASGTEEPVTSQRLSSSFQLMRVRNLPQWANKGCVGIGDVIQGKVQVALLSNYMVDIGWLLGACPLLRKVPRVVVIHGESGQSLELLQNSKPCDWVLHKPPLRLSYGTHHSKAMLLVYPTGVRVIVHTANLIHVDWNNKSQGLWMQDFPWKTDACKGKKSSVFENDLVEYLTALEWPGCTTVLPEQGEVRINAAFFRKFDFSSATVRLIASVPGYHQGHNLSKWGHMKLRKVLQEQSFEQEFKGAPIVYQFSSLGSLDEKWLSELAESMQAGSTFEKEPLGHGATQFIWPTVEDIRCSLEGYAAGNAVPSPQKNVERAFLSKYWSHWQADHSGRSRAMPHIKSYVRYHDQCLAWFLLTSSNLSKAAWGSLVKSGSQLMIRSYELGVLFLPHLVRAQFESPSFSCTEDFSPLLPQLKGQQTEKEVEKPVRHPKLVTMCWKGSASVEHRGSTMQQQDGVVVVRLPLPYALPPTKYRPEDRPWSWDRQYHQPDVYGEVWPRSVKLYSQAL
ncbi:hypothetical protein BDL97_07G041900 [Sphagnum fallax]|nr:hypothetical protein BDL97_07G041900 [Sphagnum fallax]KAH8956506.1 hypothetical protein BDL97_07G041900 [Sphagnum fallax]